MSESELFESSCASESVKTAPDEVAARKGRLRVRPDRIYEWVITGGFLFLAIYVLIYYISGPSLAFLSSDCTDSLLWSQAMVESGEILTEDFHYAALLPFGSPLWTAPILAICGYTVNAYVLSMSVFAVLFVLAAFSLFCAMKWNRPVGAFASFCVSMLLSGSAKLREIMWEHVIYYSLSILFIMVLLNLCLRLLGAAAQWKKGERDRKNSVRIGIYGGLLLLLCAGCATDGFQVLAVSVVPIIGALAAYTIFDSHNRLLSRAAVNKYLVCAVMAVGVGAGLWLLNVLTKDGAISAGYASAYSNWAPIGDWSENARKFLEQYLTLCGIEIAKNQPLFSLESILTMLKLCGALAVLVCPVLLLFRYGKLRSESSKLAVWVHVVVSAVILLGYICGSLSTVNWRLTPLLGSSILATAVYLWELFRSSEAGKRVSVILTAVLFTVSLLNAYTILKMPHDLVEDRDHAVIAQTLEEKGYTYGYATFWNAQITTLLSDSQVQVLPVHADDGGVRKNTYQVMGSRFDTEAGQESFLLLTAGEYEAVKQSEYWNELNVQYKVIDEFVCRNYHVVVFDGNALL